MKPLLVLRKLRMSINGQRLLDLPEFEVPERSCMVLSGRNGAGKTTLLRIVAGLLEPDQCEVDFGGHRQGWRGARELLRRDCIYLHQHPYMFDRSVWENVAFGLRQAGLRKTELRERVDRALDWAGLSHLAARNARQLSGGEKQRVALTRARELLYLSWSRRRRIYGRQEARGLSPFVGDIERQLEHHVTGAYSAQWRHAIG